MTRSRPLYVLVLAAAVLSSACAHQKVVREAFGRKKTYAVVTIQAVSKIKAHGDNQGGSLSGLVKAAGKNSGFSDDAGPALEAATPMVLKALRASGQFDLASPERVLGSSVYAKTPADDAGGTFGSYKTSKGYKFFALSDASKLKRLAEGLKVDGVIAVNLNFGWVFSGTNVAGLVSAGSHRASVFMTVVAYDRAGRIVWQDSTRTLSEGKLGTVGEAANFVKLHPLLLEAAGRGARDTVVALDQTVRSGAAAAPASVAKKR